MSHEERSAPVLTKEQVQDRYDSDARGHNEDVVLCDSHEALRAERDAALAYAGREEETSRKLARDLEAALAEVARLKAVARAAYHFTRANGIDGKLLADLCAQVAGFKSEDFAHE